MVTILKNTTVNLHFDV